MSVGFNTSVVAIVFASSALCACIPVYNRIRPELEFKVQDESGRPIPKSRIVVTTKTHPFRRIVENHLVETDDAGVARIEGKAKWGWIILAPDGGVGYAWNWCAEAQGHETRGGEIARGWVAVPGIEPVDMDDPVPVTLPRVPMKAEGCMDIDGRYHGPISER